MVMAGTFQSTYRNGYNWGDVRIGAKSSSNSWGSCPRHNMFCPSYNMHLYHAPTITFNFVTGTNRISCPKYNIKYCDWNMLCLEQMKHYAPTVTFHITTFSLWCLVPHFSKTEHDNNFFTLCQLDTYDFSQSTKTITGILPHYRETSFYFLNITVFHGKCEGPQ